MCKPQNAALLLLVSSSAARAQTSGTATTTRYWDCNGGACGCGYLSTANGNPAHCYSNGLFSAPTDNEHGATFYGAAAISEALGGGNWLAEGCGKCWKVTGNANVGSSTFPTTIVLKGTNFCPPSNSVCANGNPHFDIAAPGFDFLGASQAAACNQLEPNESAGFASCGNWQITEEGTASCNCDDFNNDVLKEGCQNFKDLQWNNPQVSYEEISCPPELSQLPCWAENGNTWPPSNNIPDLCLDPHAGQPIAPTTPAPTPSPTPAPTPQPQAPTPTQPPTPAPTNAPPPPTPSPTPAPTPSPTNPPPPPPPTPSSSPNACCSLDFVNCINWCGAESEATCGQVCPTQDKKPVWLPAGPPASGSCIARWGACTNDVNGCCYPGTCVGNQWYKQCVGVDG